MCAQGQALYKIGGYTEDQLRTTEQSKADREVARLLGISVAHSVLLRLINDGQPGAPSDVLTSPEKYLGPNYETVLIFWRVMDGLTENQWKEVARRYRALDPAAANAAWMAARMAATAATADPEAPAGSAAGYAAGYAAEYAAGYAARMAAAAAGYATYELMAGIDNPVFVPLFADLAS